MRNVLLLDTETTGTSDADVCIEAAIVLFNVQHAAPIRSFASLIRAESNSAESVNRIPAAMLRNAPSPEYVWSVIGRHAEQADVIVAHNADFDRRFVPAIAHNGQPWICSMDDLQWPASTNNKSLVSLALAHGLGVAHAHRALADCDLLSRLLTRVHEMGHDLAAFLARGLRPKALFESLQPYEENEKAKLAGFRWDRPEAPRMWSRKMAIEDIGSLPFKVRRIS
jgi:DNA polymerase-3 subunit epsilon